MKTISILMPLISAAYIASSLLYLHYFLTGKQSTEKVGLCILWAGFVAQTVVLVMEYVSLDRFPVIDMRESLCFFSWSMACMYLAVRARRQAAPLGTFIIPIIAVFFISCALMQRTSPVPDDRFATALFPLHIMLSFLGYSAFTLSFGSGIMYLMQEKALKSRRPGKVLERLPSIKTLDAMTYHSLVLGFPLLTLGIIIGAIWLYRLQGVFLTWDPKIPATAVMWLLYAGILHARLIAGWRGRRLAMTSVLGYVLLLFTFLGAGIISKGFHGFFEP